MTNTLPTASAITPITKKIGPCTMSEAYYKIILRLRVPSSLKPDSDRNESKLPKLTLVNQL